MRRVILTFLPLLLVLPATRAVAQQTPPQPTAEQMKAMLEQTKPGPEHRMLASLEGRWRQEITWNLGGPAPTRTTGTATNRLILGGRFLASERTAANPVGDAMGDPTVESLTIYGFDRRLGHFTVVEMDTTGTYSVAAAGPAAANGGILMAGEMFDDHSGKREIRKYDMTLRVVDADTYITSVVFKFATMPDLKIVEIVHRRIK